jgi:hypothetical protein
MSCNPPIVALLGYIAPAPIYGLSKSTPGADSHLREHQDASVMQRIAGNGHVHRSLVIV